MSHGPMERDSSSSRPTLQRLVPDAFIKVQEGETTFEELKRILV